MSAFLYKGDPEQGGIPRKALVRVEALPDRTPVFSGEASESVYLEIDPGKYVASVTKLSGKKQQNWDDCCYTHEFLFDITDEAWKSLQYMTPKVFRVVNTSKGPRWRCKLSATGCDFEGTSQISAVIHEVTVHYGIPREQFLADPMGKNVKAAITKGAAVINAATGTPNQKERMAGIYGADVVREMERREAKEAE